MHNETNAWQYMLNLIYKEALKRGLVESFLEVLGAHSQTGKAGNAKVQVRAISSANTNAAPQPAEAVGDRVVESETETKQLNDN